MIYYIEEEYVHDPLKILPSMYVERLWKTTKIFIKSKNTIFTIIIVASIGLLIGLVIHQENILTERGNIAFFKRQKNEQDVEQVKKAIKDFNIDSETIIEDWKRIQELKPNTDEGKQTLADFLTTTSDKNHQSL